MYIFRGKLFKFRLFFVILQLHLPVTATMSFENDGADGWSTTLRKSDTVRFVFDYLNVGNSRSQSKTNAEVTPTDVYIVRSRSVPRAYYAFNGTLLGALYIYS